MSMQTDTTGNEGPALAPWEAALNDAVEEVGGVEADPAPDATDADAEPSEEDGTMGLDGDDAEETDTEELNPDIEEIEVKGANGVEKIKIDYSDRAALKRAVQKAAGVDHLYKRYKDQRTELATLRETSKEKNQKEQFFDQIDGLFGQGGESGVEALVTKLAGGQKEALGVMEAIVAKHKRLASDPAYAAQLAQQKQVEEANQWKTKYEGLESKINQQSEEQTQHQLQSAVDAAFPEYSFAGKLGDTVNEQRLDEFMFAGLQSRLAQAGAKGYKPTPDLVRTILKEVADTIPAAIHQEARKLTTRSKDKVSTRAKQAAQSATLRGVAAASKGSGGGKTNWDSVDSVSDFLFEGLRAKK